MLYRRKSSVKSSSAAAAFRLLCSSSPIAINKMGSMIYICFLCCLGQKIGDSRNKGFPLFQAFKPFDDIFPLIILSVAVVGDKNDRLRNSIICAASLVVLTE